MRARVRQKERERRWGGRADAGQVSGYRPMDIQFILHVFLNVVSHANIL